MPANQKQQAAQSPSATAAQSTAKYTNKDGSKFITVPKTFNSIESSETFPAMTEINTQANGPASQSPQEINGNPPGVNRKKQKRRQKQAERLAAEQALKPQNASDPQSPIQNDRQRENGVYDPAETTRTNYTDEEGDGYSASNEQSNSPANGYTAPPASTKSKKKRKGKSSQPEQGNQPNRPTDPRNSNSNPPTDPRNVNSNPSSAPAPPLPQLGMSKEKIWNTSSQEERERIKMFWLSLGEEERRSLVKVEKDAVLKKMKEQQKHSCSCTVCGRKRIAIEEELEVLYDAYYEELEQYANHQQGQRPPPILATSRRFGPVSGLQPPNRLPPAFSGRQPSRGKIVEHFENEEDEGDEEEADDVSDEDDYFSEEPVEEIPRSHASDFFNFGQSLTVQGGILTVADDLLKNDGKKFIEMMEQLAERRMAREEDAKEQFGPNGYTHPLNGNMQPHNHTHNNGASPEEDEYDEEEEEDDDYDSQDDEYEEEEMETMTGEQRMEEGRRMFQIFAARMFEQRVLTAYKEKVAAERQEKLLQELEDENLSLVQKKAKKAKEAQKKKEKAQQKKLALAEERAKREAEKAAEEAELRAAEEKKVEEARLKAEEKRKKRDLQKKAEEEERLRKEAEKQRRIQEQRERQAEVERKQREAKERERKEKEELRQREREAKEAKEKEAKERKERLERQRRDLEAKAKAEREAKDQQKREEHAAQQATTAPHIPAQPLKRPQQHITIPLPAGLQPSHNFVTPHLPVATPVIPKAPTPNRPSTTSQKDPSSVPQTPQVGKSQSTSPNLSSTQQSSPSSFGHPAKAQAQQPFLHHPQATSPIHAALKGPANAFPPSPFVQPMSMNGFQPGMPIIAPGFVGRVQQDPMFAHQQPMGNQFRPLSGPNGMHMPPGMNGMPMQQGRGFQPQNGPPGFTQMSNSAIGGIGQSFGSHKESPPAQSHSRQQSASLEKPAFEGVVPTTQPIARPGPIGRPASIVQGQQSTENDIDGLSSHLGSSALLDDSDEPLSNNAARHSGVVPGLGIGRQGFIQNGPYGMDHSTFAGPSPSYNWGGAPNPFGTAPLPAANYMGGWGGPPSGGFGAVGGAPNRPSQPRSIAVRLMLCRACKILEGASPDDFHSISSIRDQVERLSSARDERITEKELLELCETEGNINNGGGSFEIRDEGDGRIAIRYDLGITPTPRPVGAPGEIGSPVAGSIQPMSRFPGPPGV